MYFLIKKFEFSIIFEILNSISKYSDNNDNEIPR